MARKPKAIAYTAASSDEDAAHRIGLIGSYRRGIIKIEGGLSDKIAKLKAKAEQDAVPLREKLASEEAAVHAWCEVNRVRLTKNGKKKFFDFGSGTVNWRYGRASVRIKGVPDVVERLQESGLHEFLRIKTTINKDAILEDPEQVKGVTGITIVAGVESFSIEPVDVKLSEQSEVA
jgi:phage host-nuclease inhibitor protein Gam